MRTVLVLLLLANLTLFAYTRLDVGGAGEGVRLAQQVQPDKIKLLTPQQVAALGPAKAAALPDVCVEWGPFGDADRARALAELEPLGIGRLLTQRRVEVTGTWTVTAALYATRAAADRRALELRQQDIREVSVAEAPRGQFAVNVGTFRSEELARPQVDALVRIGARNATATQRATAVAQSVIVVRDPPAPAVARLRELQGAFPAGELRIGSCERA